MYTCGADWLGPRTVSLISIRAAVVSRLAVLCAAEGGERDRARWRAYKLWKGGEYINVRISRFISATCASRFFRRELERDVSVSAKRFRATVEAYSYTTREKAMSTNTDRSDTERKMEPRTVRLSDTGKYNNRRNFVHDRAQSAPFTALRGGGILNRTHTLKGGSCMIKRSILCLVLGVLCAAPALFATGGQEEGALTGWDFQYGEGDGAR